MDRILRFLSALYDFLFGCFRLEPTFLAIVSAVEATLLSILIPVSIEVVSRVKDKYDSQAIMELYESDKASKYLPILLVANVILVVYTELLVEWNWMPRYSGSLLSIVEFFILVWTLMLVMRLFGLMKRIIGHPEWLLEEFAKGAKDQFEE